MTNHRLDGPDLGVCNLKILDNFFGSNPIQNELFRILWEYTNILKPLQNKKGQKNLGYPRKKQSFSL